MIKLFVVPFSWHCCFVPCTFYIFSVAFVFKRSRNEIQRMFVNTFHKLGFELTMSKMDGSEEQTIRHFKDLFGVSPFVCSKVCDILYMLIHVHTTPNRDICFVLFYSLNPMLLKRLPILLTYRYWTSFQHWMTPTMWWSMILFSVIIEFFFCFATVVDELLLH
jgi:hypothetical protein